MVNPDDLEVVFHIISVFSSLYLSSSDQIWFQISDSGVGQLLWCRSIFRTHQDNGARVLHWLVRAPPVIAQDS
jgi:hypothetical protein